MPERRSIWLGRPATLANLGHTLAALDRPEPARDAWRQALAIFEDLGHPSADHVRARLLSLDGGCVSVIS